MSSENAHSNKSVEQSVEQPSRSELQRENEELRERVDDLEEKVERVSKNSVSKTAVNLLLERLVPELQIDDYNRDPMEAGAVVGEFGKELGQVVDAVDENPSNPTQDPMTENWRNCIEHAKKLQNDPDHARSDGYVKLFVRDVANATGHSRRYCNDLVEKLGREHKGAKYQPPKDNPKTNGENRRKALLVSMDLWGDE